MYLQTPIEPEFCGLPLHLYSATEDEAALMPPHPWLVYRELLRRRVTLKRMRPGYDGLREALKLPLAVALGNGAWCGLDVREKAPVLLVSTEDDYGDIARELSELAAANALPTGRGARAPTSILDLSESPSQLVSRRPSTGEVRATALLNQIARDTIRHGCGLVAISLLMFAHNADPYSETQMRAVHRVFRDFARQTNAAVLLFDGEDQPDHWFIYQGGDPAWS